MKNFLIVVALLIAAAAAYKLYVGGALDSRQGEQPRGSIQRVVDSGRDIGRSTGRAFDSVTFGGRK